MHQPMNLSSKADIPQVRIVFMGTPEFSAHILDDLLRSGFNVVAVYTRADKPVGRGRTLISSPVKILASATPRVSLEQPIRFDEATITHLKQYKPDLIIVAAYGKILPKSVLNLPGFGCVNVHASLLPRWRGASPVQNALLAGDSETGITLMLMDEHMDTGTIIAQEKLTIEKTDTTTTLLEKLAPIGAMTLRKTLRAWIEGKRTAASQDDAHATLCQLIEREDGRIFWSEAAETLERRYRALTPWPGLFTFWRRTSGTLFRIKILEAEFLIDSETKTNAHPLGMVFRSGSDIHIQCGQGSLIPRVIQIEGKGRTSIIGFIAGYADFVGSILS